MDTKIFHSKLPCQDLRQSLGLAADQKLILSVGRLTRKGFDRVIESLPQPVAQGLDGHFALIGIGEDAGYLSGLARKLGMVVRVHFRGHLSPDNMPCWYNTCYVFAMPNREINGDNEGFGMVFLVAAACGKPAIAGHDGGIGSAIVDGITGFHVDGKQFEPLVKVLAEVLG